MSFSASAADERVLGVEFTDDALSVSLRDGRIITVPLVWYPRLLDATPAQRKNWKIAGGGYGLHWPDLDEDLSTEGLLRGAPAPKRTRSVVECRRIDLSERELQMLKLLAEGSTEGEIAAQLGLSKHTIRTRLERMFLRLGTRDPAAIKELVRPPSRSVSLSNERSRS
jgi:DNA-binding CsgD family transcriptional regulator